MQLELPKQAEVNKFIPKSKFFTKLDINNKTKQSFVDSIQKITWRYKLSKDTINIKSTENIEEIQVFDIELKIKEIPQKVLSFIDKTIPYPILYRFLYKDDFAFGITLKNSQAQRYYFSDWNKELQFDFVGTDLESVYQKIISAFIEKDQDNNIDFETLITKDSQREKLKKEISALRNKIKNEKHFKIQVELHGKLNQKQKDLDAINNQL